MVKRTPSMKQFDHQIEELGRIGKAWTRMEDRERGFVISYKQRTRYGVETTREVVSLRRAKNFCLKHGLALPAPASEAAHV